MELSANRKREWGVPPGLERQIFGQYPLIEFDGLSVAQPPASFLHDKNG